MVGPYASVSCSLRLLNNSIRINTTMNGDGAYQHENDQGLPTDDDRFRTNHTPVTAIATSSAQNDSGMFEFNFRDERYLPFERAGVISEWQIELSKELRQFDYSTISDVILHLDYTARDGGGPFKEKATTYLRDSFITNPNDLAEQPFMQMFDMKHEFSTEWYRFLHPAVAPGKLEFTIGRERFPFLAAEKNIVVGQVQLLAKYTVTGPHAAEISYNNTSSSSSQVTMAVHDVYGGLQVASFAVTTLDISQMISLDLNPLDLEELYLVLDYKLA